MRLVQAVFTRRGGVSPAPWDSLNVGGSIGDELANVRENRLRSFAAVDRPPDSLYDVWQVHGTEVACTDRPRPLSEPYLKADAILTDKPAVSLYMRFADCVPIFLADPVRKVVGLVHAGWQGTVRKTALAAVQALQARYGTRPADVLAGIGPSICVEHYPVGPEVVEQVRAAFGEDAPELLKPGQEQNGNLHFDLWAANRLVLSQAGVRHVELSGLCTACHPEDWYSHRGEKGRTGRFGAILALKPDA